MRRALVTALAAIVFIGIFCPGSLPTHIARDFDAFYCAGASVDAGADPYRAEPIGACERRDKGEILHGNLPVTVPAPLPPYDLAVFARIARLSYTNAVILWTALIALSLVVTIEALATVTGLSRTLLWLVLAPIDGVSATYLGEIAPIAVAGLALAMLAVRDGRPVLAALAGTLSLCEPHVGVAPIAALFLCMPKARPTIVASAVALSALCVATVGLGTTIEYFRDVLPAHALSEIPSPRQLSLTALLHTAGVSDALALTLGSLSYLTMLFVGLAAARRIALRDPVDPMFVAAPAAFVLLGGPFIHVVQMPAAFPAALLAFARSTGRMRDVLGAALVAIAIPWLSFLGFGTIFVPLVGIVAGFLTSSIFGTKPRAAIAVGACAALAAFSLEFGLAFGDVFPGHVALPPIDPHDLAEVSWAHNIRAIAHLDRSLFDAARAPTWLAIATIVVTLAISFRRRESRTLEDRRAIRFGVGTSPGTS